MLMCKEFSECEHVCLGISAAFTDSPPLLLLLIPDRISNSPPEMAPEWDPLFLCSSPHTTAEQTPLGIPAPPPHSPFPRRWGSPVTWSAQAIVSSTIRANFSSLFAACMLLITSVHQNPCPSPQACFFRWDGLLPRLLSPANIKVAPALSG